MPYTLKTWGIIILYILFIYCERDNNMKTIKSFHYLYYNINIDIFGIMINWNGIVLIVEYSVSLNYSLLDLSYMYISYSIHILFVAVIDTQIK